MPFTAEEQKLIFQVENLDKLATAKELLLQEEAALQKAIAANNTHNAVVGASAASTAAYEAQVKQLIASIQTQTSTVTALQKVTHDYRQNLIGLSYAANDFFSVSGNMQQRLNAIANNMPMLLAGFGGWGLALSAILPVLGMLTPALGDLYKLIVGGNADLETANDRVRILTDRIAELTKKPHKLAVDLNELENARKELDAIQKGLAAINALKGLQTDDEAESGKKFQEVFKGKEGDEARKTLVAQEAKRLQATDPAIQKAIKDKHLADTTAEVMDKAAEEDADPGMANRYRKEAAKARAEADAAAEVERKRRLDITKEGGEAGRNIGSLTDTATKGRGTEQAKAQMDIYNRLRTGGKSGAAHDVLNATVEGIERDHAIDAQFEAGEADDKRVHDRRLEREEKQKQEMKDIDEQFAMGEDDDRTWRQNQAKKKAKKKAENDKLKPGVAEAQKKTDDIHRSIVDDTDIDERADAAAAVYRQQGEFIDNKGRRKVLGRQGQEDALGQDLQRILAQRMPDVPALTMGNIARRMARDSMRRYDAGAMQGAGDAREVAGGLGVKPSDLAGPGVVDATVPGGRPRRGRSAPRRGPQIRPAFQSVPIGGPPKDKDDAAVIPQASNKAQQFLKAQQVQNKAMYEELQMIGTLFGEAAMQLAQQRVMFDAWRRQNQFTGQLNASGMPH